MNDLTPIINDAPILYREKIEADLATFQRTIDPGADAFETSIRTAEYARHLVEEAKVQHISAAWLPERIPTRVRNPKRGLFDADAPLTRKDVLYVSASNALDFDLPVERRGDVVYVDLTSVHPKKQFTVLVIDASFLPDLKRLKLTLKADRLYAKTFRQTARDGDWKSHICPVVSIVAAKKYGQNWDVVFLSARTKSDPLDLRASNVVIPSYESSSNTKTMNEKLNKATLSVGWRDGWLTGDGTPARGKGPKGHSPTDYEFDTRAVAASKLHIPSRPSDVHDEKEVDEADANLTSEIFSSLTQ